MSVGQEGLEHYRERRRPYRRTTASDVEPCRTSDFERFGVGQTWEEPHVLNERIVHLNLKPTVSNDARFNGPLKGRKPKASHCRSSSKKARIIVGLAAALSSTLSTS